MNYLKALSKFSFLILIGLITLIVFGLVQGSAFIFIIYPYALSISSLLVLISVVRGLTKKKWITSVLQLIGLPLAILIFYVMFYPRDLYFSHLTIPADITYKQPYKIYSKANLDTLFNHERSNFRMELNGELGRYQSFIWAKPTEEGILFLRAFDAIHNFELEQISRQTEMTVDNRNRSIYSHDLTIYDGVWGSYYLARFEVWFKPNNSRNEQKIGEQVFKIEGWIR